MQLLNAELPKRMTEYVVPPLVTEAGDGDVAFVRGGARIIFKATPRIGHLGSLCATIKLVVDAVNLHFACPRAKGEEGGGEGGE